MNEQKIALELYEDGGTVVYIAIDGTYFGSIIISDELKEDSKNL